MSEAREQTQVLVFEVGGERYCVSIPYVTEIVGVGDLTPIPNSPEHVEGVMDLRGSTTTIVDPRLLLGTDGGERGERIVVFDPEEMGDAGAVGWWVDEVYEVDTVEEETVEDPPSEDPMAQGVVRRDDGYVVWVDPTVTEV